MSRSAGYLRPVSTLRGIVGWGISLILATLLAGCGPDAAPPKSPRLVYATRIADASGLAERLFPGRARAGQEVNRSFRVSGPLIVLAVDVGDEVKTGDLLARIDPRDFETRLSTLDGQLEREKANQTRAAADLRRVESIRREDPGATSASAIDRARQAAASANASVQSLAASVQNARDQLSYTTLTAPFDGVVVATYVENFESVLVRQPIVRLLDPSSIEFVIQVPENQISLAPYVEDIAVTFDALPGISIPARIKEIGREASQATRTYPVTIEMDQPEEAEILPGMAGNANITSRPPSDTSLVGMELPMTALFSAPQSNENFVWVIDESSNTLSRRAVTLGNLSQFGVLIDSGLEAGEWIVTKGVNTLSEGEEVKILDPQAQGR